MREACLNIMMSMKGDAKAVSFIEDCAVPLEHLADYTDAITELFARHGTTRHLVRARLGRLPARAADPQHEVEPRTSRRCAPSPEAACELVRRFKGSYSGEHGDGISRSEFIAPMFGERLAGAFGEVKDAFDPDGRLNPGKIVDPLRVRRPHADALCRRATRRREPARPALDWSDWGGFGGAVEMCNNNGTCRKLAERRDVPVLPRDA